MLKLTADCFTKSDKYRKEVHNLIPGGCHTYSKGDDQFPMQSPAAIDHGKGAYVWDIDGNKFLDCSMGLTSVSLGHAYEPVMDAVKAELEKGVNFQRPSVIEKEMAETFLNIVPGHDRIKFAKNGSSVTTAAVKLARAYTGRSLVAFPVEHPFYSYDDWFIGKTACDKGVPAEIRELTVTFRAGNRADLEALFNKYPGQIAGIISEPERSDCYGYNYTEEDTASFIKFAIDLAHRNGAVYINDEMVSGFKSYFPGSAQKFDVVPDLSTWGKGIANGFSFCALTGKSEIMDLGGITAEGEEKVFLISTTHGGETHAIAAGLKTIEEFKTHDVVAHNQHLGDLLIDMLDKVLANHNMTDSIDLLRCNWSVGLVFKDSEGKVSSGFRTLMMQEMISRGVLFQGVFVPCFSHSEHDVEFFATCFEDSLSVYKQALKEGYAKYLVGIPAKPVFRKYL